MLLAGGACNCFDRLHQGFVTDYFSMNCKIEKIRKLVFNLSDSYFMELLMVIGSVVSGKKEK